jgi:hypothetical protein
MLSIEERQVVAGRYRLERALARGGMGSVWVARHLQLDVDVAVKFMAPEYAASAEARARFEREAKAGAQLKSPNVVQVHDYGVDDGAPFIVMELMEGEDLEEKLRREGRLSPADTVAVLSPVCRALRRAHEIGLVHRDLKPGNIFLARVAGEVIAKVLDFGIAKTQGPLLVGTSTKTGALLGSPHYMSPEQVRSSRVVDHRSDLWSLGVIAFRCLTGELPFPGEEVGDVLVEICSDPIPRAGAIAEGLGPDVDAFFERALVRDLEQRFQSAQEFAAALGALGGEGVPPAPPSTAEPPALDSDVAAVSVAVAGADPSAPDMAADPSEPEAPEAPDASPEEAPDAPVAPVALAAPVEPKAPLGRRRRRIVAAVGALLALVLLVPATLALADNRRLVARTEAVTRAAAEVDWNDPSVPPLDKLQKLDALRDSLALLSHYKETGPPIAYGKLLYQGDALLSPTRDAYADCLRKAFVEPAKAALEDSLRRTTGAQYLDGYEHLKAYLLLADRAHLLNGQADWEKARLTKSWAERLRRAAPAVPEADLEARLAAHVGFYVDLLQHGEAEGEQLDASLVGSVRDRLARVGSNARLYDQFVNALVGQRDPAGKPAYPPISLQTLFADRPEVLLRVKSAQKERQDKWAEVQGPYTRKGHERVVASLEEGQKLLALETWILPLTGQQQQSALERLRADYDETYINQWTSFFRDIDVTVPSNRRDAVSELRDLSTPDWPYQRLLRTLADNTQLDDAPPTPGQAPGDADPITARFRSTVGFGVPAPPAKPKEGEPPKGPAPVAAPIALAAYIAILVDLGAELETTKEGGVPMTSTLAAEALFAGAQKATRKLIWDLDSTGQELLRPLLLPPLQASVAAADKASEPRTR